MMSDTDVASRAPCRDVSCLLRSVPDRLGLGRCEVPLQHLDRNIED